MPNQQTPFSFAAALGVAALHTGITLWYRLPILMAAGAMRPHDAAELSRMASEKVAAAALGMVEGQKEVVRLCTVAMAGRLVDGHSSFASSRSAYRETER
jgi:hypothetical protein